MKILCLETAQPQRRALGEHQDGREQPQDQGDEEGEEHPSRGAGLDPDGHDRGQAGRTEDHEEHQGHGVQGRKVPLLPFHALFQRVRVLLSARALVLTRFLDVEGAQGGDAVLLGRQRAEHRDVDAPVEARVLRDRKSVV